MDYGVVVLDRDGAEIARWLQSTNSPARDDSLNWQRLSWVLGQSPESPQACEVLVCLPDEVAEVDVEVLGEVLDLGRRYSWGNSVSLVMRPSFHLDWELGAQREGVRTLLAAADQGGASGLYQSPKFSFELGSLTSDVLHRAWLEAQPRNRAREKYGGLGGWLCGVQPDRPALARLLEPFVANGQPPYVAANILVLVDGRSRVPPINFINHQIEAFPEADRLLAYLQTSLSVECLRHHAFLCDGLLFHGELELLFFLRRLNRVPRLDRPRLGRVKMVRGNTLAAFPSAHSISVLITASSDLSRHWESQILLSEHVDELFQATPAHATRHLILHVTPETLRATLVNTGSQVVWIHFGETDPPPSFEPRGVQDSDSPWLNCFREARKALSLVFFVCRDSHRLARSFAEAGARVAIGFVGELEFGYCRLLVCAVLRAAVLGGGDVRTTLRAFDLGRYLREGFDYRVLPVAYYR